MKTALLLSSSEVVTPSASEVDRHRTLWRAVMHEQIKLIVDGRSKTNATGTGGAADVRAAFEWLKTADFGEVCTLAGYDPRYVLRKMREFGVQV